MERWKGRVEVNMKGCNAKMNIGGLEHVKGGSRLDGKVEDLVERRLVGS